MNGFAARIERDFSVRRKEKQKTEFRAWLVYTLKEMGYSPKLESGEYSLSLGGTLNNVVAGDPEKAKIVLAAHYDTGVREILPPMISPTRPASFILYQALFPILVLAGSFALSLALTFPFDLPALTDLLKRVRSRNEADAKALLQAILIEVSERSGLVEVRSQLPRRRNWSISGMLAPKAGSRMTSSG